MIGAGAGLPCSRGVAGGWGFEILGGVDRLRSVLGLVIETSLGGAGVTGAARYRPCWCYDGLL